MIFIIKLINLCLKNNNNALNIIEVNYDNNYFEKNIMEKLILYIIHF